MTRVLIVSLVLSVCHALTERTTASEFDVTTTEQLPAGLPAEERLAENIARARNSSQIIPVNESDEEDAKQTDKKPRTVIHRDSGFNSRGSICCGFRHGSSGSTRPDYNYNRIPYETGRYPSQYNERYPIDRHGWQSQARPSSTTGSGGGGSGGGGGGGGGGRPTASGSYGGNYGGNGIYAGSQSSDRYGPPRPAYGSESGNRPSSLGYGSGNAGGYGYGVSGYGSSYGRPTGYGGPIGGGYGISGTLADGDEFGHGEPAYPDVSVPQHPGNLHAQKAVALKALAGVALIGAAAALASNPILLPIGIVAGRRKRSESFPDEEQIDFRMDYILNTLKEDLAKIQKHGSSNRLFVSPRCVARLTCEIQKNYLSDVGERDVEILSAHRKQYLTNLIRSNVLNSVSVNANVRNLIKLAVGVATENRSCDVFPCTYIKRG